MTAQEKVMTAREKHVFSFGNGEFLLDGKSFQIISGEMHPARIPREYWRHRIRMAKAMGCNTIAVYVFWNYLEATPGNFDLTIENRMHYSELYHEYIQRRKSVSTQSFITKAQQVIEDINL